MDETIGVTLITGAAGFIGFHLSQLLLSRGVRVVGLDNLNEYYDVTLKLARLRRLEAHPNFTFERVDLADSATMGDLFARVRPARVAHLAAQAGVRYSLEHPGSYVQSNLVGFLSVLEGCRRHGVEHLVYASTSSVYGSNTNMPFSVHRGTEHPISLYAATKKANEMMAHAYSHLFRVPTTGLRFFTVYGPWGRPDMAMFRFTKAILEGQPIEVYNHGEMARDFTYVDDIVEAFARALDHVAEPNPDWSGDDPDPGSSSAPYRIYNIGNASPVPLMRMIEVLESCLGRTAEKRMLPLQPGDVTETYADVSDLEQMMGFRPTTSIEDGVARFVEWYRSYYGAPA